MNWSAKDGVVVVLASKEAASPRDPRPLRGPQRNRFGHRGHARQAAWPMILSLWTGPASVRPAKFPIAFATHVVAVTSYGNLMYFSEVGSQWNSTTLASFSLPGPAAIAVRPNGEVGIVAMDHLQVSLMFY
jgi:hypothetical protein